MRKLYFLIINLLVLVGCQNEMYKDAKEDFKSEQGVFVVNKGTLQNFIEENKEVVLKDLKIGLVQKVEHEVTVSLEAGNETQLDAYNVKNGTSYVLLPKDMYEVSSNITFEPRYTSMVVPVQLKNVQFSTKGTYALPIKITGGDVTAIGGQTDALIVFEQKIVTKALRLTGSGPEDGSMFPNDFKVSQWTMEVMVNRASYPSNNRAICGTKVVSNSPPADEIFTRFGDVTISPNQLQIKTGGSQIDIPADKLSAKPNTWYMLSFVYDGKSTFVYIDGVLAVEREIRTGAYGMTGFWLSGLNDLIREVRFYKIARTPQQIASSVWKMVDYNDDNLILYYPMNGKKYDRETGQIVDDETQVWDWSKSGKNLPMVSGARFDNNGGDMFVFPPSTAK